MKNKKLLLGLFFGIILIISSYSVLAGIPVTLNSPIVGRNYSGTFTFSCSIYNVTNTGLMGNYNISLYFNNSVNTSGLGHSQFSIGALALKTNTAGRVVSVFNTSVNQTEFNITVSLNSSFFTPNAFTNLTCYAFNDTDGNYSRAIYPVRIDSINPNVTINLPLNNYTNYSDHYSGLVYLNVTISDDLGGGTNISSVYFNITKSDGSQWNISTAANGTAKSAATVWYYSTVNASDFPDGIYNVTAYVTDRAGSINSSQIKFSIIFDNSGPGISAFSCSPTSVNVGRATTCTCTATDLTPFTYNAYGTSPAVSSVGAHTLTCTTSDQFGLESSTTTTYTVTSGGVSTTSGVGAGGTTTTTWTSTLVVTNTQLEEGYTQELKAQEIMKLTVAGGTHHVGVKSVTATSATIEISSDPVSVKLDIGEDAKVDVDNDGTYDLYVKLNSITNSKADVTVKKLSEVVPAGAGPVSTSGEIETTTTGGDEGGAAGGRKTWIYIVVIVVILVIV